jgi:hypothetical protein
MARGAKQFSAKFEQVLLYADGPQVVLLSAPSKSKIIGVAINLEGYQNPFFAAQISDDQFHDYLNEKFDLRYLLLKPDFRRHFLFDLGSVHDGFVEVLRYNFQSDIEEEFLPDAGVFSRDHTEIFKSDTEEVQSLQTFGIDGKWDLPEFSRFYGQVTDLYSLFYGVDIFLDEQADIDQRQRVQNAFVKPFEGGGSYVSLYDSLAIAAPRTNRLRVEGIEYNSPGFVRVRGKPKPLAEVRELLEHLERNSFAIAEEYRALLRLLSVNKLRRFPASQFNSNSTLYPAVLDLTKRLVEAMDVASHDSLLKMASGNALVAAKVALSIYRRAYRLNEFFLQGRASFDTPTSAA